MYKILLVEDSETAKDLINHTLRNLAEITWAETIATAFQKLKVNDFDLILLDVGLPDGDGFRFYSLYLTENSEKNIPVIFLTANINLSDKVLGFSLGADDYITKPFQPSELKARVEMRLKKASAQNLKSQVLKAGPLEVHLSSQRAFLNVNNQKTEIPLTPLEFKLLTFLASHEDSVFSRNQILDRVWGGETHLTDRSIDTHICGLRKKLADFGDHIESVYGEGYRFKKKAN